MPRVRLEHLYRCSFTYPRDWSVALERDGGREAEHFFLAEGRCEGRITGELTGANHPHQRADGTFVPDFHGAIDTDDGAVILFTFRGYGRVYPVGRRQIVGAVVHVSDDDRYRWLNDSVAVSTGEVRSQEDGPALLVIDVAELIWEPIDGE
jgi:hypothetical protein